MHWYFKRARKFLENGQNLSAAVDDFTRSRTHSSLEYVSQGGQIVVATNTMQDHLGLSNTLTSMDFNQTS